MHGSASCVFNVFRTDDTWQILLSGGAVGRNDTATDTPDEKYRRTTSKSFIIIYDLFSGGRNDFDSNNMSPVRRLKRRTCVFRGNNSKYIVFTHTVRLRVLLYFIQTSFFFFYTYIPRRGDLYVRRQIRSR